MRQDFRIAAGNARRYAAAALASGDSIKGHANDAHGGIIDPDCPACKELEAKRAQLVRTS